MIKKNVKVGAVKGVTVIELGKGDVIVASATQKEEKYTAVTFINDIPRKIGTSHNTAGVSSDDTEPQAMITFTDVKSIEVVEKALKKAKIYLRNL